MFEVIITIMMLATPVVLYLDHRRKINNIKAYYKQLRENTLEPYERGKDE